MEPDSTADSETGSPTPSGWWRRQTYDYCSYYLDSDGIIQKIYHDPADVEESRTRGRARTPPPQKGALKKTENPSSAKDADRGSTPVSFKPPARPPKYFLQGRPRTSNITNDLYGPTRLEMNQFRSHDSEGETAWHSSQSPNDLDAPPSETATPRLLGTIYVHRNTRDGGYQIWVWCNHEGSERELWWRPVDLENEQFAHPKIATRLVVSSSKHTAFSVTLCHRASNFPTHSWRDDDKVIDSEDETIGYSSHSSEYSDTDRSILNDFQQNTGSSSTPRPTATPITTDIENLILGLTTSVSISSTTDTQILGNMDPASTPKPESTENAPIPSSPEVLFRQMNSATSLLGHTMDNLDTRGKTNSGSLSEGSDCPAEELCRPSERPGYHSKGSGRPSEGSGHPLEGSGCPSERSDRLKWFRNV
ncbi:hypothetical protein F5879DRAFT_927921, partial [Lentinula edodes]